MTTRRSKDVGVDLAYWAVCALLDVSREPVAALVKDEPPWAGRAAPRVDEEYFTTSGQRVILDDGPCGLEQMKF